MRCLDVQDVEAPQCFVQRVLPLLAYTHCFHVGRVPDDNFLSHMATVDCVEQYEGADPHRPGTRWPQ